MVHVAYEGHLPLLGLTGQEIGLLQFLVLLLQCGIDLLDLADMSSERLLHHHETVLQLAYGVGTVAVRQGLVEVPVSDTLCRDCQLVQRGNGAADDLIADDEQQ